jgi:hypothetical protein
METHKFLSYHNIVNLVGIVPITGYTLPIDDIIYLRFKRITCTSLKKLIEFPLIKNQ